MHTFKGKKVFCSSVETTPYLMEMGVFFHYLMEMGVFFHYLMEMGVFFYYLMEMGVFFYYLNECLEFERKNNIRC